jgi:phage terminase large subunit GpA-like protein
MATAVDSQFNTQVVANWCRDRWGRRVWAVRGIAGEGKPIWPTKPGKRSKTRLPFFNVGVDTAKETVYARLRVADASAPGYCYFNMGYDEDYFTQLTSEEVRTTYKKGMPIRSWHLKPGQKRNEALDCRAYSLAALEGLKMMGLRLRSSTPPQKEPTPEEEQQPAEAPASKVVSKKKRAAPARGRRVVRPRRR